MDEVERLLRLLRHGDAPARKEADALGAIGDARAVEPLCLALSDEEFSVRKHAAAALVRFGRAAVEPLCRVLASPLYYARWWAVEALSKVGDAPAVAAILRRTENNGAVQTLCAVLSDSNHSLDVWAFAAETLGDLETREVLLALKSAQMRVAQSGHLPCLAAIREAIEKIEKVTAATKSLPRPASAPPPDTTTLPRPAHAPNFEVDKLPRPADG